MCTVTYLPINQHEFILTSNRDEDVTRPAALPVSEYKIHNRTIYFPKDQKANGTWIAHNEAGYTLCLLNGAYVPHVQKPQYKKSRGILLLDFYRYNDAETFVKTYDFSEIEPFTLLLVYSCSTSKKVILHELKWDEENAVLTLCDSSLPHIWSSVTLYSNEIIKARESWFQQWLTENTVFNSDAILFFHHFGGNGSNHNDLIINRGTKKTVNICCIHKSSLSTIIIYEDILSKKLYKSKIINC